MTLLEILLADQINSLMASYNSPMQPIAEDVEYEDVSGTENKLIEAKEDER